MIRTRTLWRHLDGRNIRHPVLRVMFALIGVALLGMLLVMGVAVGLAMILFGLLQRTLGRRPTTSAPQAGAGTVIDGEFRVVDRNKASLAR